MELEIKTISHKLKKVRNRQNMYVTACGMRMRISDFSPIFWTNVTCEDCLNHYSKNKKYYEPKKKIKEKEPEVENKFDIEKFLKWKKENYSK